MWTEIDLNETEIDLNESEIDLNESEIDLNESETDLNESEIDLNESENDLNECEHFIVEVGWLGSILVYEWPQIFIFSSKHCCTYENWGFLNNMWQFLSTHTTCLNFSATSKFIIQLITPDLNLTPKMSSDKSGVSLY